MTETADAPEPAASPDLWFTDSRREEDGVRTNIFYRLVHNVEFGEVMYEHEEMPGRSL